jgi:hypothetical protein
MAVEVSEPIVKSDHNTSFGSISLYHTVHEIAQADNRILIFVKKTHLLRKYFRAGCRLIVRVFALPIAIRDAVIHQDGNTYLFVRKYVLQGMKKVQCSQSICTGG